MKPVMNFMKLGRLCLDLFLLFFCLIMILSYSLPTTFVMFNRDKGLSQLLHCRSINFPEMNLGLTTL